MSVSLFVLPLNIIQYMSRIWLDPKDISLLRATCRYMRTNLRDEAKIYRTDSEIEILFRACRYNHMDIAQYIFKYCPSPSNNINTALETACIWNQLEMAKWCKSNGATRFNWPMYHACKRGHLEIAKWCASNGAIDFDYAMYGACEGGHLEIVKWCGSKGATKYGNAILHIPIGVFMNVRDWVTQQLTKKRKLNVY